jgi:hypothetical protein
LTEKMRASNFTVSAMHGDMPQKVGEDGWCRCPGQGGARQYRDLPQLTRLSLVVLG